LSLFSVRITSANFSKASRTAEGNNSHETENSAIERCSVPPSVLQLELTCPEDPALRREIFYYLTINYGVG
jgi:hypothetical protein